MVTLNDLQKYQLFRIGSFLGLIGALFFITRLSPWEASGYNQVRFALLMAAVITGIGSSIATMYYRSKIRHMTVSSIEVDALAAVGSQIKQPPIQTTRQDKSKML